MGEGRLCHHCGGSGDLGECERCDGERTLKVPVVTIARTVPCIACAGSGTVDGVEWVPVIWLTDDKRSGSVSVMWDAAALPGDLGLGPRLRLRWPVPSPAARPGLPDPEVEELLRQFDSIFD